MAINGESRTHLPNSMAHVRPGSFDAVATDLVDAIHHHVRLRDACLAPSEAIADKLDLLDRHRWPRSTSASPATEQSAAHTSVVAQMSDIRRQIRDGAATLSSERRLLVLLEVLATTPEMPGPQLTWSKTPVDLIGEAATGLGYGGADVRRLTRRLDIARHALPPVTIGPSTTRAIAESLRGVLSCTPGASVAHAVLLLSDQVPAEWVPPMCGTVLLDRVGEGPSRFLGSQVARHDLAAFVEDLATLRVAAEISPTIRSYAVELLPQLAHDLRTLPYVAAEQQTCLVAAGLTQRTAALITRGFRRFDRPGRTHRFAVGR